MALWLAALMGIIEGLTEFLPISSTGHLIIFGPLLGFDKTKTPPWWSGTLEAWQGRCDAFEIFIQLGAILAVVIYFRRRIWETALAALGSGRLAANPERARRLIVGTVVATLPAVVVGLAAKRFVDKLPPPNFVAWVLIGGGVLLWAVDQWRPKARLNEAEDFGWGTIILIGCAQTLAMLLPGFSRSGATIMAALLLGASIKAAAEFSFFLSIPTMFLACSYSLLKHRHDLAATDAGVFAVGFLVAFVSAFLVVKGFLAFLQKHSFKGFAYYRVAFGALVLAVGRFF